MRITLLCTLLLCAQAFRAQPTLDAMPVTGSVFGYHDVPSIPGGGGGTALTWDLSALPEGNLVPYTWITTDIAPGAGAFPGNALVREVPGEPTSYFQDLDTALMWMGTYTDTALLRFDPPLVELSTPLHFGDEWSDTAIVAVTGAGRISILDVQHHVIADAWGSLIMPYGTVRNVLRVKSELILLDRRYPDHPIRSELRYSWYSPLTPMPLLVIIERSGWAPPDRIARWLDGSWQEDPAALFRPVVLRPFPDPCVANVTVDLPAKRVDRTILRLVDANGNVAMQWHEEFNSPQTRRLVLDVSSVPAGHYTLSWMGTTGTLGSARLEKQ